jgi:hypothetical protein
MDTLKRLQQMQALDAMTSEFDITENNGEFVVAGAAEVEQTNVSHLQAFGGFLERTAAGEIGDADFAAALDAAGAVVLKDSQTFPRQVNARPKLADIAEAWLEQNERMLEAYEEARRFLQSGDEAHLSESYRMIEEVLAERAPLYRFFDL